MNTLKQTYFAVLLALMIGFFAGDVRAQNPSDGTGTDGTPLFRVTINSTATASQRLDAATTRVGNAPAGYRFWIEYKDGKFERGGVAISGNVFISYVITSSTAAWWQFWRAGSGSTGCLDSGNVTISGYWRYYVVTVDGVVADSGWDFIVTGISAETSPECYNGFGNYT